MKNDAYTTNFQPVNSDLSPFYSFSVLGPAGPELGVIQEIHTNNCSTQSQMCAIYDPRGTISTNIQLKADACMFLLFCFDCFVGEELGKTLKIWNNSAVCAADYLRRRRAIGSASTSLHKCIGIAPRLN